MPFPILYLAVAFISGIITASLIQTEPVLCLAVLGAALAASWTFFFLKKDRAAFLFLLAAMAAGGAAHYSHCTIEHAQNSLHMLTSDAYLDFYGTIVKSPSRETDRTILLVEVEKTGFGKEDKNIRGRLRVTVPRSADSPGGLNLHARDKVKLSARLTASKDFRNFHGSFFGRYLQSQGIHNRAYTKSALLVEKTGGCPKGSFLHGISRLRERLQKKLEDYFRNPRQDSPASISPQGAILEALLLGEEGRMDPSTVTTLQKTGLYHLFAISGAHIAIIAFLLFSLLKLARVRRRPSYVVLMGLLVFYAFLVEGSPSVLRATIMTLAFLAGKLLWKDVHLLNTISLSALILLVLNPANLFDLGFELTFTATLTIILFFPKILRRLPKLPLKMDELTAMSLAAQAGVLPFIVGSFNRVTFSSLILNYAAIPLVGLIMGLGYVFLPLSFLAPFLARPLAWFLNGLIGFFLRLTHVLDPLHFLSYRIPTPHLWTVLGYFLFLGLLLLPSKFKGQKAAVSLGFAAFFAVLIIYPFSPGSKEFKVTYIDVGQGESILVEFPGTKKMLIDGGGFPEGTFDVGESVVSPFLWRKGMKTIDVMVLTHAHPDHLNGLAACARNFRVKEFWEALSPEDAGVYRELKQALRPSTIQRKAFRGFRQKLAGAEFEIFHPAEGPDGLPGSVDNEKSIVMRIIFGKTSFLFAADIGYQAEADILDKTGEIRAQVLKSPHHGSKSSSSEAFLNKVHPEIIVISAGWANRYGFPSPEVLDRYAAAGAAVYRTDLDGAVEISSDGTRLRVRTAAGPSAQTSGTRRGERLNPSPGRVSRD